MHQRNLIIPTLADNEACVPNYASQQAAGADLKAHIEEAVTLESGRSALIPTGIRVAIPEGYEIQVRPRSGLALRSGITVLNTPGTIDSDYRGEIAVILINHGREPFVVTPGMRIAQLIVAPVVQGDFVLTESLPTTERGSQGFGHTGTH